MRTRTVFLIIILIIAALLSASGYYLWGYYSTTTATITQATCTPDSLNSNLSDCTLTLTYAIGGNNYQATLYTKSATPPSSGQTMTIDYDITNPGNIMNHTPFLLWTISFQGLGIMVTVVAGLIALFALIGLFVN